MAIINISLRRHQLHTWLCTVKVHKLWLSQEIKPESTCFSGALLPTTRTHNRHCLKALALGSTLSGF